MNQRRIEAAIRTAAAVFLWLAALATDGWLAVLFGVLAALFTLGAASGWWLSFHGPEVHDE
jgi:hypothetical protein